MPCAVNGRAQTWIYKARNSGVLALHPVTDPVPTKLDKLVQEFVAQCGKMTPVGKP